MDPNFNAEIGQLARTVWGVDSDALAGIDAVLVMMMVRFAQTRPAMGRSDRVALKAITELSTINGELARDLMIELRG